MLYFPSSPTVRLKSRAGRCLHLGVTVAPTTTNHLDSNWGVYIGANPIDK